jgi:hypothetical protein
MKIRASDLEMQRALISAREQCRLRLELAGYDDKDAIPENILNVCLKETLSSLDLPSLMPEHFAALEKIRADMDAKWSIATNDSLALSERVAARSQVETQIKNEPWTKNLLVDFPSALKAEIAEVRKEFIARVHLGGKK